MLFIADNKHDADTLKTLSEFKQEIDDLPENEHRPEEVDRLWKKYTQRVIFSKIIFPKLKAISPGIGRCCYCENYEATTCDHIAPKSHYPQKTFALENLIYICSDCNASKNNSWAMLLPSIDGQNRQIHILSTREKYTVPNPPPNGDDLLLNPRKDDPTKRMRLLINRIDSEDDKLEFEPMVPSEDISHYTALLSLGEKLTFHKRIIEHQQQDWISTFYTIFILKLNRRPELARRRKHAYSTYKERLHSYIVRRNAGTNPKQLEKIAQNFRQEDHVTVWFEIKRLYENGNLRTIDPELFQDLVLAPEALAW